MTHTYNFIEFKATITIEEHIKKYSFGNAAITKERIAEHIKGLLDEFDWDILSINVENIKEGECLVYFEDGEPFAEKNYKE
jgi:hypothetical protein